MDIENFNDLLRAARAQSAPQRLLFVFTDTVLPDTPTPEQVASFEAERGGMLAPVMCVDKLPTELGAFDTLVEESERIGPHWEIVFVAGLAGQGQALPGNAEVEDAFKRMIAGINAGSVGNFLAFRRDGKLIAL